MNILTRYLLRAHLGPFLFAFIALTGVILINTLVRRLADLAGKGLPAGVIFRFFYLALPATIALTFPMAVLVAVLYTFSQFTAENEVTALKASGVDLKRLLLPLLLAAGLITGSMVWFNDRVLPEANFRWSQLWLDIARKTPTMILQPQTINRIAPSNAQTYYLRASRVDPGTNRMWDVVIFDVSNPTVTRTIFADSGRATFNRDRTDLILRLFDGHVREVAADQPESFRRIDFREQLLGIPGVGTSLNIGEAEEGARGDREMTIAMLQARKDTLRREQTRVLTDAREVAMADLDVLLGTEGKRRVMQSFGEGEVASRTVRAAESLRSLHQQMDDFDEQIRAYEVEVQKKYSIAVATLVFVIIGAPLAVRFPGGGVGLVIAASLAIFSLYYVGLIGGEALAGKGYVTPIMAMWVMNAVMTVLGVFLLTRMGRESSSGRGGGLDAVWQSVRDWFTDRLARPKGRPA